MTSSHGTEAAMEGRFPGASSAGNVNDNNSKTYFSPHAYVMIRVGRFVSSSSSRGSCFTRACASSMTGKCLSLLIRTNKAGDRLRQLPTRNEVLTQQRRGLQAT